MNKHLYILIFIFVFNSCQEKIIIQEGSFEETLVKNKNFTERILKFVQDKKLEQLKYNKLSVVQLEDYLSTTNENNAIQEDFVKAYSNGSKVESLVLELVKSMEERNLIFNKDSQYGAYQLKIYSSLNNTEFISSIRLNNEYGFYVISRLYDDKFKFQDFNIAPM